LSEPVRIGARLKRIPLDLLLALINATALLVIAAAILAIVAMARVDSFAKRTVGTMTEAVLSKLDLPPRAALDNLRNLTEEVRSLGDSLREIKASENQPAQARIERLSEALTALKASIDRLANSRTILTDDVIEQLGRTVADTLSKVRSCSYDTGQKRALLR
jgi:hypothetical protein